jgi:ribosome-associated toxin RatA of RatAB toxin-antitoxin module
MADRTTSSVVVDAPPAQVLAVIADFEAYPQWTGAVKAVEVLAGSDPATRVRFVLDAGVIKDTYVLDYEWATTSSGTGTVSWTLVSAEQVLKALDGSYTLAGTPEGPTTVTYELVVDVRIPMIGVIKRKAEKNIITTALQELKKRVEG